MYVIERHNIHAMNILCFKAIKFHESLVYNQYTINHVANIKNQFYLFKKMLSSTMHILFEKDNETKF